MEICFRDHLNLLFLSGRCSPFRWTWPNAPGACCWHPEKWKRFQATFCTSGSGSMQVKSAQRYPAVWEKTRLLLAFPTTYLIEQGFNQVIHVLYKYRNCLDLMPWGAVQLKLTSLQPALKKLTGNIKHRAHTNFQSIHIYLSNTINMPII